MIAADSEAKQLIHDLVTFSWNCTSEEGSIAKTVIALSQGTLYKQVKEDEKRLKAAGNLVYIRDFLNSVEKLQSIFDVDKNSEIVLDWVLALAKTRRHRVLVHNFYQLNEAGIVQHLYDFGSDFRGYIKKIYPLEDICIVYAEKVAEANNTYFVIVGNRLISRCYATLEQAMVGAVAYKYEGCNHRADSYFFRMVEMNNA